MANLGTKYGHKDGARYVKYYYAEFYDTTRRPKRKRISLRTRDKRVAVQKFADLERQVAMGLSDPWVANYPSGDTLLAEAVAQFVKSREGHCGDQTVSTYRYILEAFASALGPQFPLQSVEARHLQKYLSRDLADATRTNYGQRLRIFFNWCVGEGLLRDNPVPKIRPSKRSRRKDLPEFISERDFESLLAVIMADAVMRPEIDDNGWLVDAITFAVFTGLRRAELCNLRWRDVDLSSGFVTVANTDTFTTKSGRERRVPLSGPAKGVVTRMTLERSDEDDGGTVFKGAQGTRINDQYLSARFRHYRRMARLPDEINFHSLRHTFASWAAQGGMNLYTLKEIMGHADIKQTQVYASLSPETLQVEMERVYGI